MNALLKIQLSRESNTLVSQLKTGELKGLEKIRASRRLNEITVQLGGGSTPAAEQQVEAQPEVDLSPFERIVNNGEITVETLKGAVSSTKLLMNAALNPPVFVQAIQKVAEEMEKSSFYDSLGDSATEIIQDLEQMLQMHSLMLDASNSPDDTHLNMKKLVSMLVEKGWTLTKNRIWSAQDEGFKFRISGNRLYTYDIEIYQQLQNVNTLTTNGVNLQESIDFLNEYITNTENRLDNVIPSGKEDFETRLKNLLDRRGDDPGTAGDPQNITARNSMTEEYISIPDAMAQTAETARDTGNESLTQEQLEANNYQVARFDISGLKIAIENPIGSIRSGVDEGGKAWQTTMSAHYGYIEDTKGADGDEVDVFVAPDTPHDWDGRVFVLHQLDQNGNFDEHKVVLGETSKVRATALYQAHYDENGNGIGLIHEMSMDDFKEWLKNPAVMYDSAISLMTDSWASDGKYEMLPRSKLSLSAYDSNIKEARATMREPVVVLEKGGKYLVVHGKKRLEIADTTGEKLIPAILFDADEGYTLADIKNAVKKCGNVVHAEALGVLIERVASARLEESLA